MEPFGCCEWRPMNLAHLAHLVPGVNTIRVTFPAYPLGIGVIPAVSSVKVMPQ